MIAIEVVGIDPTTNIAIRTRHYTPEGVLAEYAIRQAQGQRQVHKETIDLAPWSPDTCTHRPKPRQGGDHAQH